MKKTDCTNVDSILISVLPLMDLNTEREMNAMIFSNISFEGNNALLHENRLGEFLTWLDTERRFAVQQEQLKKINERSITEQLKDLSVIKEQIGFIKEYVEDVKRLNTKSKLNANPNNKSALKADKSIRRKAKWTQPKLRF